jgi:hypothetical protein
MRKILVLSLLILPLILTGCWKTTVDGEHTGYITAVEKNGAIWKTGRAYIKTDKSSSQEDAYCVENQEVFNQLKEKAVNQEKITVVFHSEMIIAPWRCGEEIAVIDKIK